MFFLFKSFHIEESLDAKAIRHRYLLRRVDGFTLVEMVVVVAIIAFFAVLLLVKHNQFGESVAINNLAYEVGLAIREAQVFGISVREQSSGDFDSAYGVQFDMSSPLKMSSFRDIYPPGSPDGKYNLGQGELIKTYNIGKGNYIEDICVLNGSSENCSVNLLHITFLRPEPEANFVITPSITADTAILKLRSPKGLSRHVKVTTSGQISIE